MPALEPLETAGEQSGRKCRTRMLKDVQGCAITPTTPLLRRVRNLPGQLLFRRECFTLELVTIPVLDRVVYTMTECPSEAQYRYLVDKGIAATYYLLETNSGDSQE